jgi:hypothetical protein
MVSSRQGLPTPSPSDGHLSLTPIYRGVYYWEPSSTRLPGRLSIPPDRKATSIIPSSPKDRKISLRISR